MVKGQLIGVLDGGGAEVHQIPVNYTEPPSDPGMRHVANVPIPEGKQARVIVLMYSVVTSSTTYSRLPALYIGGNFITRYSGQYKFGGASTVTGPVAVEVERRDTSATPSFVGEIFWWEVDE